MGKIPQYTGQTDTRTFSPAIWYDFPIEWQWRRADAFFFFDDFAGHGIVAAGAEANYPPYKGFASTGGSGADAALQWGAVTYSSDGDNEGASLCLACTPVQISSHLGVVCFEARIKTSTIADTKHGIFCGLIDACTLGATVPIAADGTIADENLVGFHRLEGDGDTFDTIYKANGVTAVTVKADAVTLVADTFIKIGMRFDPANSNKLTFYSDGAALADTKTIPNATGTDFPADVTMGLVFAVLNATGTTPGSSTIDWWALGQLPA